MGTLGHVRPLVIGHRGIPGHLPEHTEESYRTAVRLGADAVETDVVMSGDGELVVRHEPELSRSTDIAARPEFEERRTTKVIDGVAVSGWFTEDLTLAELRTLHCPTSRDRILTLDELLHVLAEEANGRPLGLHLEIKHPTYFESVGLPMTAAVLDTLRRHGLHQPGKGVWLQSFDDAFLRRLAPKTPLPLVQLVDQGKAFSCRSVATYARAIGPDRALVLLADARPTGLVGEAHEAGLEVFVWTLRGDVAQARRFFDAGVDGVFTDYAERALVARDGLLGRVS